MRDAVVTNRLVELDPLMTALLQELPSEFYDTLYKSTRLPIMDTLGVLLEKCDEDSSSNSSAHVQDPFNIQYYKSDEHKKLQKLYGLPDAMFAKNILPLTLSVFQELDARTNDMGQEALAKHLPVHLFNDSLCNFHRYLFWTS
jgi:hypothetical protein